MSRCAASRRRDPADGRRVAVVVSCRQRPAAYVLDRLAQLGRTLAYQPAIAFPVWACENCVQHLLGQVLDVTSVASVCRLESFRQAAHGVVADRIDFWLRTRTAARRRCRSSRRSAPC